MNHMTTLHKQRGVTLIVGLIMLVLITLMVATAFMLSSTNLKSVGNMQYRDEAIAAANVAIDRVVSTDFTAVPAPSVHTVDVAQNGTAFTVNVGLPTCIKSIGITSLPATDPDYVTCSIGIGGAPVCFDTVWELTATVSPTGAAAATGAVATVKQGVSRRLNVIHAASC
jgi:Tfp pilus assembly protein PilX